MIEYTKKNRSNAADPVKTFLNHVMIDDSNRCWEWQGPLMTTGYGVIKCGNRKADNFYTTGAHRFSYQLFNGEIPAGHYVCHTCDNRKCVNPRHLFTGTAKDNMQDASKKQRIPMGTKHVHAKLDPDKVREIRKLKKAGLSCQKISEQFNVYNTVIWKVCAGQIWKHVKDN